ncbi:hypothetical protein BC826DRAFT_1109564 [Russula brevipes]|nr:hypothetical protein BC826DRAFT_1109564 [Russula brevipes]
MPESVRTAQQIRTSLPIHSPPNSSLATLRLPFSPSSNSKPGTSRRSDDRLTRWLDPTVNVFMPSPRLGDFGLAAMHFRASQGTVIFERIEGFFRCLEIYPDVSPTAEMTDIISNITVEVLKRLDKLKLTTEGARMAIAQVLKATRSVDRG